MDQYNPRYLFRISREEKGGQSVGKSTPPPPPFPHSPINLPQNSRSLFPGSLIFTFCLSLPSSQSRDRMRETRSGRHFSFSFLSPRGRRGRRNGKRASARYRRKEEAFVAEEEGEKVLRCSERPSKTCGGRGVERTAGGILSFEKCL